MSLSWRPDYPPTDPSILQVCSFVIPDKSKQYRSSYAAQAVTNWSATAFHTTVLGSRMVKKSDGTPFIFFGSDRLEEWNASTLSNVSAGGGSPYTVGVRWWFCQFGDETLACNGTDATQTRSGATGTAFAAHGTAPKAKIILAQSGHVLALNYNDGAANPAGIKWASQGSSSTWTNTSSNTAGSITLKESQGEIVGGAEIHDIVVVWKKTSMYVGRRIGGAGTDIWRFNLLSPKIGLLHQEAWVSTPVGIIFMSPDSGVFKFDGSVPVPIDDGVRGEMFRRLADAPTAYISHDAASSCVFIWIGGSTIAWCYNYLTSEGTKPYNGSLGSASFTNITTPVRDANYIDYIALGGDSDVLRRRCHLIVTNENKVCNLNKSSASTGISPQFICYAVRDPKAAPRQNTLFTRVMPIWGWDFEAQGFREPTSGIATVIPRTRLAGGDIASVPTTLDSAKGFDMTLSNNSFTFQYDFTDQLLILADFAYTTEAGGVT